MSDSAGMTVAAVEAAYVLMDRDAAHDESFEFARRLGAQEGILGGITSGTNTAAALRVAARLGAGKRVVTVVVDTGLKYLAGDLYS